jgi:hypothetical protein
MPVRTTVKPPIDVGPWHKGLVENISPWDIPDGALQECINFDVMDDGLLRARRGFKRAIDANNWLDSGGAIAGNQPITASLFADLEGPSASRYAFASAAGATNGSKWLVTSDPSAGWTVLGDVIIAGGHVYSSSVVYQNTVYVPATTYSGVGFGGGAKFPLSGLNNIGGTNLVGISAANLPHGEQSYMIKDRMFVVSIDESKIFWSKATDPVTWASPDGGFVLVNPNDGSSITSTVLFRDILYIFKTTGIWQFSFGGDPATDGLLQKITDEFGGVAATDDTSIYFANSNGVYILQNGVPQLLSPELNWHTTLLNTIFVRSQDMRVIALPGQLIVIYGNGIEGVCLNTRTGAWSRYQFGPGSNVTMHGGFTTRQCRTAGGQTYYVMDSKPFSAQFYYFREDWNSPRDYLDDKIMRIPRYRFKTKYLTLGERVKWKRLKATWVDAYLVPPTSAGGANSLMGISLNTGFSNEARTQVNEAAPGVVNGRFFKLANRHFLSLAFTLDSSTGASYQPAVDGSNKDSLIDAGVPPVQPYWFVRKFVTEMAPKKMMVQ